MNKKVSIDFYGHENSLQMDLYKTSYSRKLVLKRSNSKNVWGKVHLEQCFEHKIYKSNCNVSYKKVSFKKNKQTIAYTCTRKTSEYPF